jgi:hypothetical protein
MDSDLTSRLQDLSVTSGGAKGRTAAAIAAYGAERNSRPGRSQRLIAACLVVICLVVAASFSAPGRSVAEAAGELIGIGSPDTPEQVDEYTQQVDLMFQDVIAKAQAGDLDADVDSEEVVRVMNMALSPPKDPQIAAEQEKLVTTMLGKLRAAGDIPPSGQADSYGYPSDHP